MPYFYYYAVMLPDFNNLSGATDRLHPLQKENMLYCDEQNVEFSLASFG